MPFIDNEDVCINHFMQISSKWKLGFQPVPRISNEENNGKLEKGEEPKRIAHVFVGSD